VVTVMTQVQTYGLTVPDLETGHCTRSNQYKRRRQLLQTVPRPLPTHPPTEFQANTPLSSSHSHKPRPKSSSAPQNSTPPPSAPPHTSPQPPPYIPHTPHNPLLHMLHQHPNRPAILQIEPQPHSVRPELTLARAPELHIQCLRRRLVAPSLCGEGYGRGSVARGCGFVAGGVVPMNVVCPCTERLADGISTLRDDVFACASELVVDTLRAASAYSQTDLGGGNTDMFSLSYGFLTPRHSKRRKQRIGQQGCSLAQHGRQRICTSTFSAKHSSPPQTNPPVTPAKLTLL